MFVRTHHRADRSLRERVSVTHLMLLPMTLTAVSANTFSVVTFIRFCERRAAKFGVAPVDVEGMWLEQQLREVRKKYGLLLDDESEDEDLGERRFRVCSVFWLRSYFDDELTVPYESTLVLVRCPCVRWPQHCSTHPVFPLWQMIFLHVVNLAVLFSDPGQSSFFFLFIFSCLHVVDIGLRIVAEGWSDFWYAACAASHDSWSHAFFTHAPRALIQAFHTSPEASRAGHQAVRRRRPSLRCHGHRGIGGLDPAGWRVPI